LVLILAVFPGKDGGFPDLAGDLAWLGVISRALLGLASSRLSKKVA
jgi:hypothetical protein